MNSDQPVPWGYPPPLPMAPMDIWDPLLSPDPRTITIPYSEYLCELLSMHLSFILSLTWLCSDLQARVWAMDAASNLGLNPNTIPEDDIDAGGRAVDQPAPSSVPRTDSHESASDKPKSRVRVAVSSGVDQRRPSPYLQRLFCISEALRKLTAKRF